MQDVASAKPARVLRLTAPHSPSAYEAHARFLADSDPDEEIDLQIPTALKGDDLGGLGAATQLIVTWARRRTPGTLRTFVPGLAGNHSGVGVDPNRLAAVENLVRSDHGLLALLMAHRVVDVKGQSLLGLTANPVSERLEKAGRTTTAKRGRKVALVVADHRSNNSPFALYQPAPSNTTGHAIRTRDEFESLAKELLKVIDLGVSGLRPSPTQGRSLGTVLFQLFKNTHDWARTTVDERNYERSVRILRSEYVADSLAAHMAHAADDISLQTYLKHDVHKGEQRSDAKKDMRRFLEVSIMDSGPGLAARVLRAQGLDNPTVAQEHDALLACLKKHSTSSHQRGRGNGLHVVQELMTDLQGYMKVRSGRLALIRDYVGDPYMPSNADEPRMSGWMHGAGVPTELAPIAGTFISFVIPIKLVRVVGTPDAMGDRR